MSVGEDEAPTRELTLDEAVAFAVALQKNEQLAEAGELYRRVLETSPTHSAALHYSGVLAHQQGKNDQAIALIERSLAAAPDQADWFSVASFQSDGQLDKAIGAYQRAIALDPGHANAHSNLGVLLRATGKTAEAETAYRTAIRLNPDHIDAYTNLGILLNGLGRTQEATACYCKVITLRPKHPEARKLLALAHCALGEVSEAVRIFEEWLVDDPEDPIARHMLAACTGRDVPARASNAFVERTFDSFAASFESRLQRLSYRAPALVVALLESSGREPSAPHVLDLAVAPACGALVPRPPIDWRRSVLRNAGPREGKGVYDTLVEAELTAYLRDNENAFDTIVSADTLVYFGDLERVVSAAAGALRTNGLLLFTLEDAGEREAGAGYRLEMHGRYCHAGAYVERLLTSSGLQTEIVHADLRMEAGVPVPGLVIRATKSAKRSRVRGLQRRQHARIPERHLTQPDACRVEDRVGDRGNQRLADRFAASIVRQIGTVGVGIAIHQDDVDSFRTVRMRQRGTRIPVHARHLFRVELDLFVERPAQRVQHAPLDRATERLGVDDQPAIVRAHQALHPDTAGAAVHFDLGDLRHNGLAPVRISHAAAGQNVASSNFLG